MTGPGGNSPDAGGGSSYRYTFTDLLTGAEQGSFPLEGVAFSEQMSSVGKLTGRLPTTDPLIRVIDPWAASTVRHTGLYVERDGVLVWGGIVWGRSRNPAGGGLVLTAATFESWLAYAFLRADANFIGAGYGGPSTIKALVNTVQGYPHGNIGLDVAGASWPGGVGGDGTGEHQVYGKLYAAADVRSLADIIDAWVTDWHIPLEWRVVLGKGGARPYTQTLRVAEGPLVTGDRLSLHYPGEILTWALEEDGTAQVNELVGQATGVGGGKVFTYRTATDVGSDELTGGGYPLLGQAYSVGGSNVPLSTVSDTLDGVLLDRLAQGEKLTDVTVQPDLPDWPSYSVGDVVDLEIVDVSFPEYPGPALFAGYRITGREVTPPAGTSAEKVKLTVVPPADRLPRSVTVTAQLRDMLIRLRTLETQP